MLSNSESFTRITLLQRAQAGSNSPAWEEVLRYYEPFVRKTLFHMRVEASEIDDVSQLVLEKLWKGLKNYRRDEQRARFRTWLRKLIRNVVINDYWKRKRQICTEEVGPEVLSRLTAESSELEQKIEVEWQHHVIGLAMSRIEKIFTGKAIEVYLRVQEGESYEEVGESLGISKRSTYVLKCRVNKRLLQEVAEIRKGLEFPDLQT